MEFVMAQLLLIHKYNDGKIRTKYRTCLKKIQTNKCVSKGMLGEQELCSVLEELGTV